MSKLIFSEEELYAEAPVETPHVANGVRMHGGFDGEGRYVPPRVVTNDDLSQWMETSDEWIRQRTGIEK